MKIFVVPKNIAIDDSADDSEIHLISYLICTVSCKKNMYYPI